jgi:hypothetical protein
MGAAGKMTVRGNLITTRSNISAVWVMAAFRRESQTAKVITAELGLKHWGDLPGHLSCALKAMDILERAFLGKPRSRMRRYRTTNTGMAESEELERES